MKLLLGNLVLMGEGKRFSLTAPSISFLKPPATHEAEDCSRRNDYAVAKIWGYAHNANEAGREGVGCATMMMRCAL
ncbi:hypothetical protein FHX08_002031 [Rhizobium sp. BK529]|nr:hypothetical protein [Rhizobium sp. BK529]TCS08365.1 hypothetical protein EV281_101224 [Rhizobium sp. BK418]